MRKDDTLENPAINEGKLSVRSRIIRFGFSSAISFVLTIGLTALQHELLGLGEAWAYGNTLVLMFFWNYFFLRMWVFPASRYSHSMGTQLARSLLVSIGTRGGEWLAFVIARSVTDLHYLILVGIIAIVSFLLKFVVLDKLIFSPKRETTEKAGPDAVAGSGDAKCLEIDPEVAGR